MYPYIDFFGKSIPSYGLFMVLGIIIAFIISSLYSKKQGLNTDNVFIIAGCLILGGIVGAKLLYVFVSYTPSQLLYLLKQGDLSAFGGSGFVFYGGLIGGIVGGFSGTKLANAKRKPYINAIVPSIPFAHALGRIGCYYAGCCYGFQYNGFLASKHYVLIDDIVSIESAFPVQLVEAFLNVLLGIFLIFYAKKHSSVLLAYVILYAVMRFLLEFLRGDAERGSIGFLSTSQLISCIIFIGCVIYLTVSHIKSKEKET